MSINIELEHEQVDIIMVQELTRQIDDFEANKHPLGMTIFDDDPAKDAVLIQQQIDAMRLVREWYTA
jgi:hypothetical protein